MKSEKICKKGICVDGRTIKLKNSKTKKLIKKTMKKIHKLSKADSITTEHIYFYNIKEKKAYNVAKLSTWNKNKEEQGFLFSAFFRGWAGETKDGNFEHRLSGPQIMIFLEYSSKDIEADPSWAYLSGISIQKPYAFGLRGKKMKSGYNKLNNLPDKSKHSTSKINASTFKTFIKNKESILQKTDLHKEFAHSKPYIETYANLLDAYYHKSVTGDKDVFDVVRKV